MKAVGALGAVIGVGFGIFVGISPSSSLAPIPVPGPTSTGSIGITTVGGATEFDSYFSEVRSTIVLPQVAEPSPLIESFKEQVVTPPNTAFHLNRPGSPSMLSIVLGLVTIILPVIGNMSLWVKLAAASIVLSSVSVFMFNLSPLYRVRRFLDYRRENLALLQLMAMKDEELDVSRTLLTKQAKFIADIEDRSRRQIAQKDAEAATAAASAAAEIHRLKSEKDAADGRVRRELDPDGFYRSEHSLSYVVWSIRKRTLDEARLCRNALVKEKERHRNTIQEHETARETERAKVRRADVVRAEEMSTLRTEQDELREQRRDMTTQRSRLVARTKELDTRAKALDRDQELANQAIASAKEGEERAKESVTTVQAELSTVRQKLSATEEKRKKADFTAREDRELWADGNKRVRKAREDLQEMKLEKKTMESEKKTSDERLKRSQREVTLYKDKVIKLQDALKRQTEAPTDKPVTQQAELGQKESERIQALEVEKAELQRQLNAREEEHRQSEAVNRANAELEAQVNAAREEKRVLEGVEQATKTQLEEELGAVRREKTELEGAIKAQLEAAHQSGREQGLQEVRDEAGNAMEMTSSADHDLQAKEGELSAATQLLQTERTKSESLQQEVQNLQAALTSANQAHQTTINNERAWRTTAENNFQQLQATLTSTQLSLGSLVGTNQNYQTTITTERAWRTTAENNIQQLQSQNRLQNASLAEKQIDIDKLSHGIAIRDLKVKASKDDKVRLLALLNEACSTGTTLEPDSVMTSLIMAEQTLDSLSQVLDEHGENIAWDNVLEELRKACIDGQRITELCSHMTNVGTVDEPVMLCYKKELIKQAAAINACLVQLIDMIEDVPNRPEGLHSFIADLILLPREEVDPTVEQPGASNEASQPSTYPEPTEAESASSQAMPYYQGAAPPYNPAWATGAPQEPPSDQRSVASLNNASVASRPMLAPRTRRRPANHAQRITAPQVSSSAAPSLADDESNLDPALRSPATAPVFGSTTYGASSRNVPGSQGAGQQHGGSTQTTAGDNGQAASATADNDSESEDSDTDVAKDLNRKMLERVNQADQAANPRPGPAPNPNARR